MSSFLEFFKRAREGTHQPVVNIGYASQSVKIERESIKFKKFYAMRFGRSKLPELIIVTVFGIGGEANMSTLVNMYRAMRGSPAALLGGAMLITGTVVVGYKRLYEPYAARKRREESEFIAEYIFRAEQHAKGLEVPDGFGERHQADG
ncbi:hypothetical protein pipiens_004382 [Culex pipiens pipiens]|uniref:Uncharacterized protein n=1 Tax=Culex pipiens pipiens TaxID=38569 RepID=A0ABD1CKM4_CULPP